MTSGKQLIVFFFLIFIVLVLIFLVLFCLVFFFFVFIFLWTVSSCIIFDFITFSDGFELLLARRKFGLLRSSQGSLLFLFGFQPRFLHLLILLQLLIFEILIIVTMLHDHFEGQEALGEFLLRVQDSSLEFNDWLDVNDSRDVKSHIEQTRIEYVFEDEGDLKVAEIVQEGQLVHDLDHKVFI